MIEPSDALVVPIDLAALCVGDTDVNGSASNPFGTKDFARLSPDFTLLPYAAEGVAHNTGPYLSTQALPDAFQEASDPLDVGVHLHWQLPAALTHGAQGSDGSIAFPRVPNRWLILRMVSEGTDGATPVTGLRAWVLESDRLWEGGGPGESEDLVQNRRSLAIPIQPRPNVQPNKSWMLLGRVFDLVGWAEDPSAQRADLTAVGYGEATYAATYQLCPNVFGFWDPMSDIDPQGQARISYLLAGWHADAGNDPLTRITYPAGATHEQKLAAIADAYQWTFAADPAAPVPTRTLYHSQLTDIPWDRKTHYLERRTPAPGGVEVAVGNTTPEALSALLANKPDLAAEPGIELVLNALQLGLLSRLQLPGGLRDLDEALLQAGFASTTDSSVWTIEPNTDANTDAHTAAASGAPRLSDLPPDIGSALNALNHTQSELDRLSREIGSLRGRIFTDWARYVQIEYSPPPGGGTGIPADAARQFISAEVAALEAQLGRLPGLRQSVESARAALEAKLGDGYLLSLTDGPRFWSPTDPVLLFSGEEIAPSYRSHARQVVDPAGRLVCRTGTGLMTSMTAAVDGAQFTIHAVDLPSPAPNAALPVSTLLALLAGEAFLLDPVQAPVLASAVARLGGEGNPAVADFDAFSRAVAAAQAGLFEGAEPGSITFTGTLPGRVSFKAWAKPWIPIILQWETEHFPNAIPPYPADFITRNYNFDEGGIDLRFKGSIPVDPTVRRTYQGTIVLASNTEINIREQIEAYLANFPDDDVDGELHDILDRMQLPAQAQALSGFNQGFLMLARILQMQVSDPLGILKGLFFANFTNVTVRNAVDDWNVDSPLANNTFSPLRNGGFRISRVRVIDTFGQPLDMTSPALIRAESMIPPTESQELINLPIRFTQPTQLRFNWLSAVDDAVESNSHPATTPVFGWVLFNRLDRALMIYDEAGQALGSLNLLGPLWQGAPGNQDTYDKPIEQVFADANPHLRDFALGINAAADPPAYLAEMLKVIDAAVGFIAPGQGQPFDSLSVLIGRPIALARASLDLQLQGLPAMDQGMAAFGAAVAAGDPLAREAGNAPDVRVPVVLGDFGDIDDGLVGYFIDGSGAKDFQTFYSSAASPEDRNGVVAPTFDQITLTTAADSVPVTVSMLIDPNAPIHARTGLLPLEQLQIPTAMTSDELARIAVTFLTTPILTGGDAGMPVPQESGYLWNWVTQVAGTGRWTVAPVTETSGISLVQQQVQEGWLKLEHAPSTLRRRGGPAATAEETP